jgi:hypothetical protein
LAARVLRITLEQASTIQHDKPDNTAILRQPINRTGTDTYASRLRAAEPSHHRFVHGVRSPARAPAHRAGSALLRDLLPEMRRVEEVKPEH